MLDDRFRRRVAVATPWRRGTDTQANQSPFSLARRAAGSSGSGSGAVREDSDGAEGLVEVKAAGGITMAQEPDSAQFDSMPRSAIATGCIELTMTPQELGREMKRIGRSHLNSAASRDEMEQNESVLKHIFRILQLRSGTDFSGYKRSTVNRRVARRMALRQVDDLWQYADVLKEEPDEVRALAQDFLIRVTGFFRYPDTYEGLAETVFPALLDGHGVTDPMRIWVPGCASGEEAYSIAIALLEFVASRPDTTPRIQIFGTDLSEIAIEKARNGVYGEGIAEGVSPERLQRFFVKIDRHYQVSKAVRDLCIFAHHDVTRDPPFSRLGLVSCRNLLIYLDQPLQRRILPPFHYGLNRDGFLLLGPSENIRRSSELSTRRRASPDLSPAADARARGCGTSRG